MHEKFNDDPNIRRLLGNNAVHQIDALAFYKLLMTTSNLHSTVSTFYETIGETGLARYHSGLSKRFLTEANAVKILKVETPKGP